MTFLLIATDNLELLRDAGSSDVTVNLHIAPGDVAPGGGIPWDVLNAKFEVDATVTVEITNKKFGGIATLHGQLSPEALQAHPELEAEGLATFRVHGFELARGRAQCEDARLIAVAA